MPALVCSTYFCVRLQRLIRTLADGYNVQNDALGIAAKVGQTTTQEIDTYTLEDIRMYALTPPYPLMCSDAFVLFQAQLHRARRLRLPRRLRAWGQLQLQRDDLSGPCQLQSGGRLLQRDERRPGAEAEAY